MSNIAKRINIVSIKMVKESSFQYLARQILSPNGAYQMIKEQLEGLDREQFIIACLTTKHEPPTIRITRPLNKAIVHSREVVSNATSIMAFHNHPSGDTTPCDLDIQLKHYQWTF